MNEEELRERLAAIEQRLDAQLVWQASVMPALVSLLRLPADAVALQMNIVSLIEEADAQGLWSMLPPEQRARAREHAEDFRRMAAGGSASWQPETGLRGSQTSG